jgi:hypothetical protein
MMMKTKTMTKSEELDKWYKDSKYEDFKVFVRPDECDKTSVEELAGEVLESIKRLERDELPILDTSMY